MKKITYKNSGVSVLAGDELVERIKKIVSKTQKASTIGGFSGLFPVPDKNGEYLISGCCDGVGTKLKLAFLLNKHDTVGIDLVAMNVNDLICTGAKPLFFLDYFACGKLNVDQAEAVIRGIHRGCVDSGCMLLGGETAEMPGFYERGEYDLAGFAVGIVHKNKVIDPKSASDGDVILGLPSSGIHSNGYSLVRKVLSVAEIKKHGKALIAPTKIYVKPVLALLDHFSSAKKNIVKGIAHITGSGWKGNIPRALPSGFEARIRRGSWKILDLFNLIQKNAQISESEMFDTFNMGIGMIVIVDPAAAASSIKILKKHGIQAVHLGEVRKGNREVVLL